MKKPEGVITPHPDCKVCAANAEHEKKLLEKAKQVLAEYNKIINAIRKN